MVFAAYADVGSGLAFLLLTGLSGVGMVALALRALLRPAVLRHPGTYLVAAGLTQAWAVYWWARSRLASLPRGSVEWLWLASLLAVLASLAALVFWRAKGGPHAEEEDRCTP